ncbi:MAG: glycosyltransferase, partial [Candidatus Thorarchaeota archaeon]
SGTNSIYLHINTLSAVAGSCRLQSALQAILEHEDRDLVRGYHEDDIQDADFARIKQLWDVVEGIITTLPGTHSSERRPLAKNLEVETKIFSPNVLELFDSIYDEKVMTNLTLLAKMIRNNNKKIVFINSTSFGGGVAELLHQLIPLARALGVEAHWYVLTTLSKYDYTDEEGNLSNRFYDTTKKIHNLLQGKPGKLSTEEANIYEETLAYNAEILKQVLSDPDTVYFVEDPQPAGLIPYIRKWNSDARIIARLHIDTSGVKKDSKLWNDFLKKFWDEADMISFQKEEFVRPTNAPKMYMPPCINIFADKNRDLTEEEIKSAFDGLKDHRGNKIDITVPYLLEVSRFDPWKGQDKLIEAFQKIEDEYPDLHLYLVGNYAKDDPEGAEYYDKLCGLAGNDQRIHLLSNLDNNDIRVNALQRLARIGFQLSTREGFGLTVTELLWKMTPVIAGDVGGIKEQIVDSVNGFLVNPVDIDEVVSRTKEILDNPEKAKMMAEFGHLIVEEEFVVTSEMMHRFVQALAPLDELKRDGAIRVGRLAEEVIARASGKPRLALIYGRGKTYKKEGVPDGEALVNELINYWDSHPELAERFRIDLNNKIKRFNIYLEIPRNKSPGSNEIWTTARNKIVIGEQLYNKLLAENPEELFDLIIQTVANTDVNLKDRKDKVVSRANPVDEIEISDKNLKKRSVSQQDVELSIKEAIEGGQAFGIDLARFKQVDADAAVDVLFTGTPEEIATRLVGAFVYDSDEARINARKQLSQYLARSDPNILKSGLKLLIQTAQNSPQET